MVAIGKKRKLVRDLEGLTHSQRCRHMSLLGRTNRGTAELRNLLDSLDGDLFEWQLRLAAAKAAREQADIIAGIGHPLRSVRTCAIHGLSVVPATPEEYADLIRNAVPADRGRLLKSIRKNGNTVVADQIIEAVHDNYGAADAVSLLPACSAAVVAEWLPRLDYAIGNWASIARAHPQVFLAFVRTQMEKSPMSSISWWACAGTGLVELVGDYPDEILELWVDCNDHDWVPEPLRPVLNILAGRRPDRTVDLLLDLSDGDQVIRYLPSIRRAVARKASPATVERLAVAIGHNHKALASLLKRLAPSRREALFAAAIAGSERSQLEVSSELLAVLPYHVRYAEARRMRGIASIVSRPAKYAELLESLPVEEVWETLQEETQSSSAVYRRSGYRRLVRSAITCGDPEYLDRLFDELARLKNEQDPVRRAALSALSRCPPQQIETRHIDGLTNLATWAVEARDTSYQTRTALETLLLRVVADSATAERQHLIEPCIEALSILTGSGRLTSLGARRVPLPTGGEFILFDALESQIDHRLKWGDPSLLFSLVNFLGRRAHNVDGLQRLIGETTRSLDQARAHKAIDLWLAPSKTRGERVELVLKHDSSAALLPTVFSAVSLGRQDLLDVVLSGQVMRGKFATNKVRTIPLISSGLLRWNNAQRKKYGDLLVKVADDKNASYMRSRSISVLSRVPEVADQHLFGLLKSDDVIVVEAALAGLSWLQRPETSVATLASYLDGDRARVATFSMSRATQYVEPGDLAALSRQVLASDSTKLTARKETVRILARNRTQENLMVLSELWDARPLHKDLTIALGSALRSYADEPLTKDVLQSMATGSVSEVLAFLELAVPLRWPEPLRGFLAGLVLPLARSSDHHRVSQLMWATLAGWRVSSPEASGVFRNAIADLGFRVDLQMIVAQFFVLVNGFPDDPVFLETVRQLVDQEPPNDSNAGAERDRPIEQRLRLLSAVLPMSPRVSARVREAAEHVVASGYPAASTRLFLQSAEDGVASPTFSRLAELGVEHQSMVPGFYSEVHTWLSASENTARSRSSDWLTLADQLMGLGSTAGAALALGVVAVVGPQLGWPDEARMVVRKLRELEDPWLRSYSEALVIHRE